MTNTKGFNYWYNEKSKTEGKEIHKWNFVYIELNLSDSMFVNSAVLYLHNIHCTAGGFG